MTRDNDILALEAQEILELKAKLKAQRKKKNYSGSKLRKHFEEAKRLKEEFDFSFADIQLWLRNKKRVKMTVNGVKSAYRRIDAEIEKNAEVEI